LVCIANAASTKGNAAVNDELARKTGPDTLWQPAEIHGFGVGAGRAVPIFKVVPSAPVAYPRATKRVLQVAKAIGINSCT
jgi:hypothetical protein